MSVFDDIMRLSALPHGDRRTQLTYIVGRRADAIAAALELPPEQAAEIVRQLVPDAALRRTDKPREDVNPSQWFVRSLLEQLRDACETPREYATIATGYWCGLRAVEYTLLQWGDLGWNPGDCRRGRADVIRVTRVKKRHRSRGELRTRMIHDVVLDKGTVRALREWWDDREDADADSPWIFPGQHGQQACAKTILRHYQKVAERCPSYDPGEYRWRRVHALRHTIAVHMVEGGFEMADIRTRLGHTSLSSTQVYAQMSTPRKRTTSRDMGISHAVVGF